MEQTTSFTITRNNIHKITESYFSFRTAINEFVLIDLRSPLEYFKGHIPGAVNVPLFNNDERALVGTVYKKSGPHSAVQIGLEIFAEKSREFLIEIQEITKDKTPLIYCARGGMRSASVKMFLEASGINSTIVLQGGYKAYRKSVQEILIEFSRHPLIVLNGRTGSGKSDFLRSISHIVPVVDFEKIARHRGSAFGGFNQPGPQPSQQNFENILCEEYLKVKDADFIVVEIENVIGNIMVPQPLQKHVLSSPMILITRDLKERINLISKEYIDHWSEINDEEFKIALKYLTRYLSENERQHLLDLLTKRDFNNIVKILLQKRYDPVYDRGLKKFDKQIIKTFHFPHDRDKAVEYLLKNNHIIS